MRKKFIPILGGLILLSLFSSCNQNKMKIPDGVLTPQEMVPLLVDIHLVDGILHQQKTIRQVKEDSAFNYYPSILKKHGLNRAMFDSTIMFYSQYPEDFSKIYDEVLEKLSKMEGDRRELMDIKIDSLE